MRQRTKRTLGKERKKGEQKESVGMKVMNVTVLNMIEFCIYYFR